MADDALHPHVRFATLYGEPTSDFLNASTAISRLESLLEDARSIKATLDQQMPLEDRWHPWFGAEIISYYAVGYVTCLEWHARSRIVDLFTYKPSALKTDDLRGQVSDKIMAQLVAEGASVARLIGASTSIGSFNKYMAVMSRILGDLGGTHNAFQSLQCLRPGSANPWVSGDDFERLESLFNFRNELVHEIGRGIVGHFNIRDNWNPDEAVSYGELTLSLMRGIEAALSNCAPEDFPNLLDFDGYPIWPIDRLKREITKLENSIDKAIASYEQIESRGAHESWEKETWEKARDAARASFTAEMDFIGGAGFLHCRYIDLKTPLMLEIATARVTYLRSLLSEIGVLWGNDSDTPSTRAGDEHESR